MIIDGVKIDFGIIDQTILKDIENGDVIISASSNSKYSRPYNGGNTVNVIAPHEKIAYLEKDYFLLDGSFIFPEDNRQYDVGWESENASNQTSGEIDDYIEYKFENTHVSYGVQLYFRDDCIARDFTVSFYKDDDFIGAINAQGNVDAIYTDYSAYLYWNRIRITFTKVNEGQRARLSEITFGVNETFVGDNLINISASRRTDISGDYNDCGDFSFSFFNEKLDMRNIKGLAMGLMEWLRTIIWVKYRGKDDFERFGEYYSETADVQEKGKVVTITGFDGLYKLNESTYHNGRIYPEGRSLADWAREVADDASVEVEIDPAFEQIMSHGYITDVPHREAFRLIAEAGNGILIVEPSGIIHIKQVQMHDIAEFTDDIIVEDSLTIENPDKNLGVNVTAYEYIMPIKAYETEEELDHDTTELSYIEEVGLTEQTQSFDVVYGSYPVWIGDITIKSTGEKVTSPQIFIDTANTNAEVTNIVRYADHISFDISLMKPNNPLYDPSKVQNTTFITITGRPYSTVASTVTEGSNVKNVKEIKDNYLIDTDLAPKVAAYQYDVIGRKYSYAAEIVNEDMVNLEDRTIIQGNHVLVEGIAFSLEYGEHSVTIEGIDCEEREE